MLAVQPPKNTKPKTLSANILPCRIHNDGPVDVSSRHWKPVADGENGGMFKPPFFVYMENPDGAISGQENATNPN